MIGRSLRGRATSENPASRKALAIPVIAVSEPARFLRQVRPDSPRPWCRPGEAAYSQTASRMVGSSPEPRRFPWTKMQVIAQTGGSSMPAGSGDRASLGNDVRGPSEHHATGTPSWWTT
jgi:hypothetical protein